MRTIAGFICLLLFAVSTVAAQAEADEPLNATPAPAAQAEEEWPSAVEIESSTSESKEGPTETAAQEPPPGAEAWPAAVAVAYPEVEKKPGETGIYSKKVHGKLWLEAFVGPSSYDLDRFGAENAFFRVDDLGFPKVKGPEFGAAFGGALADQVFFIGASYRQANYKAGGVDIYKLMKVGLDMQAVVTVVPYVHPLIRLDTGYARVFDGVFSAADQKTNGLYFTLGAGIRVPIVRWVSFVATFDWSYVTIFLKNGGGVSISGQQLGGTFGLTLHFIGVKK